MIPVLTEKVDTCVICEEVAGNRDLLYVETQDEADTLDADIGDTVCKDCTAALIVADN